LLGPSSTHSSHRLSPKAGAVLSWAPNQPFCISIVAIIRIRIQNVSTASPSTVPRDGPAEEGGREKKRAKANRQGARATRHARRAPVDPRLPDGVLGAPAARASRAFPFLFPAAPVGFTRTHMAT